MTKDDKKIIQSFMDDFWRFFRKYLETEDSDDFWDEVVKAADELMQKYNHRPAFDQTIAGYVDGLDEEWRKSTGRWLDGSDDRDFRTL